MKKNILILTLLLLSAVTSLTAQRPSVIENVLTRSVDEKVSSLQKLTGFSDAQAEQLRKTELNFLLDVNRAEHCFLCCRQKRIGKLKRKRDTELQKILERDQYIRYEAINNERIEMRPLRAD
ncbi:MAG: hypothetical protein LBH72_06560 [Proteiniphilum sp.]|jgi:predicted component of type VI protein secretion system|nr:hypothetical protein [Proteiniphilum sp.]